MPDHTILVVDDSSTIRRIINSELTAAGYNVITAKDGMEALAVIEWSEKVPDLITLDIDMPVMGGFEVCERLRSAKDNAARRKQEAAAVPILFVSANDSLENRRRGFRLEIMAQVPKFFISSSNDRETALRFFHAGATDYLSKPFIEEEFQARVDIHLRARKYVRELQRLNEKLQFIAVRDSLTGLFNRGYVQDKLDKGFEQAKKTNTPFAAILFDIDHFKAINDDCGHAFGDLVIVDFANMLKTLIDKKNIVGRYGGEEFVVLLPNIERAAAVALADSVRRRCETYNYSDRTTSMRVTVSAGVAALPDAIITSPDELLRRTDEALYLAKTNGRNRVCCYGSN